MDAYDAGWPVYGTTIADYATRPVATRSRPASVTKRSRKRRSDAGKPRKRVLKAGSKALPAGLKAQNGPQAHSQKWQQELPTKSMVYRPILSVPNPLGLHRGR
jgi:hypothetical protein